MNKQLFNRETSVIPFQRASSTTPMHSRAGSACFDLAAFEASIERLIKAINRLGYTRNAKALAAAAERCYEVEQFLRDSESVSLEANAHVSAQQRLQNDIDALLLVQAHQLLAQARSLLHAPLEPITREGNLVELCPNYRELTDAAFEQMLAESDIPQLLSSDKQQAKQPAKTNVQYLTLVYSRD